MSENISAPNTFTKEGIFYFNRRVPSDLRSHYSSPKISYSLRTKSLPVARARAMQATCKLDEYWYFLRSQAADIPGKHLLRLSFEKARTHTADAEHVNSSVPTLSEAVVTYLRLKGVGKAKTFRSAAERSCGYVIDICGDRPITDYRKADANAFRDAMLAKGLAGSSITRVFGTVRAVYNFAASEAGISATNPFASVYFDRRAGVTGRLPISVEDIRAVQKRCRKMDDEVRWLAALVADTGMRLAEAAGLLREDFIRLDDGIVVARIQPHPWRGLKTEGSRREIPLMGSAAWAAERILARGDDSPFAFPRYNRTDTTNANSASAALNKWLKALVQEGSTMHGFRHAMRDRLRAVECPADIVDQIGGWQTEGVGHGYGKGYPIPVLLKWLQAVEL